MTPKSEGRSSMTESGCLGLRLDVFVGGRIVCELKAVESIHPVHVAQLPTQLKLTDLHLGFLINFNVALIKDGIRRVIR